MCMALAWALRIHLTGQTQSSCPHGAYNPVGRQTLNGCDHVTDNSQHLLNAISVMIIFGRGLRKLKDSGLKDTSPSFHSLCESGVQAQLILVVIHRKKMVLLPKLGLCSLVPNRDTETEFGVN